MVKMTTYLVTLVDAVEPYSKKEILVQACCADDMQQFVDTLDLTHLGLTEPRVMDIDAEAAKHLPLAETQE